MMNDASPAQSDQLRPPGPTQHQQESAASNGPKRRRRAALACRDCRLRKTKCDHTVPVRASDEMLRGMTKSAQIYIRSLEGRLRSFEDRHHATQSTPGSSDAPHAPSIPAHTPSRPPDVDHVQRHVAATSGRPRQVIVSTSPEIFMGGKTGEAFTQLILNAMNRGSARLETQTFSSPRDSTRDVTEPDLFAPPPHARELIKVYFDFHHVLTPIFHAPSTVARLNLVLSHASSHLADHVYALAILNMICAVASSHNRPGMAGSDAAARSYYDTAMRLVQPNMLSEWSLELVQVLLLGARYLQSASYPQECWNVLGLAVRIAYGLELHRPVPDDIDLMSKEVRKRVWYACFGFDQLLSMIYGRPATTSAAAFDTPLPEDLDDDCIQPSRLLYPSVRTTSAMTFFLQVSKLYCLLEKAGALAARPVLDNAVQLDEEFEDWYSKVPASLKIREGEQVEDDRTLILTLRANMVRILIHRPSLVSALSALSSREEQPPAHLGGLRLSMLRRSREICVRTAEETIQLVGQRHEKTKNATGPSWFNLYYLFNAILVIVSHIVDPEFQEDRSALVHLDQAIHMIRQMSANHLCAQRAYTFLEQLLGVLDSTLPEDRQQRPASLRAGRVTTPPAMTEPSTAAAGQGLPEDVVIPDLWSFWGATQDLTTDLGFQLEMHSTMDSGLWSWDMQNPGGGEQAAAVLVSPAAGGTTLSG